MTTNKVYVVKGLDWTGYGHHGIVGYFATRALAKTAKAEAKTNPKFNAYEEFVVEAHNLITE